MPKVFRALRTTFTVHPLYLTVQSMGRWCMYGARMTYYGHMHTVQATGSFQVNRDQTVGKGCQLPGERPSHPMIGKLRRACLEACSPSRLMARLLVPASSGHRFLPTITLIDRRFWENYALTMRHGSIHKAG